MADTLCAGRFDSLDRLVGVRLFLGQMRYDDIGAFARVQQRRPRVRCPNRRR
jgi:hypothetical protein